MRWEGVSYVFDGLLIRTTELLHTNCDVPSVSIKCGQFVE